MNVILVLINIDCVYSKIIYKYSVPYTDKRTYKKPLNNRGI